MLISTNFNGLKNQAYVDYVEKIKLENSLHKLTTGNTCTPACPPKES